MNALKVQKVEVNRTPLKSRTDAVSVTEMSPTELGWFKCKIKINFGQKNKCFWSHLSHTILTINLLAHNESYEPGAQITKKLKFNIWAFRVKYFRKIRQLNRVIELDSIRSLLWFRASQPECRVEGATKYWHYYLLFMFYL